MFLVQVWLRQKYYASQVRPNRGSNSWPPDHDSTFHVTDMRCYVVVSLCLCPVVDFSLQEVCCSACIGCAVIIAVVMLCNCQALDVLVTSHCSTYITQVESCQWHIFTMILDIFNTKIKSENGHQFICIVHQIKVNSYSASHDNWCTVTLWNRTMTAQCEGMGEVGSARYEPALLPPCQSIRVLSYSNCQRSTHSSIGPGSVSVKTYLLSLTYFFKRLGSIGSPSQYMQIFYYTCVQCTYLVNSQCQLSDREEMC